MKNRIVIILALMGALLLLRTESYPQSELAFQARLYEARDRVLPALVHVEPIKKIYTTGEKQRTLVTGSGVIFSPDGFVITNHHVAVNAEKVWCTLSNKERITAKVVGSDPSTDIAVLKLNLEELKDAHVPFARLGDSDSLQVGEIVMALGSPLGLSRSVSMGVISSIDRYFPNTGSMISPYNLWIQTDAAINPGNSGGPLINLQGEVVGINARGVFLAENLGFAIPINLAHEVAQKIIHGATIRRSWIGVELQPLKDYQEYLGDSAIPGVLVSHVENNSPASKAGIRPGDVLVEVDHQPLSAKYEEDLPGVRKILADLPRDEEVRVRILRNGKPTELSLRAVAEPLIERPEFEAAALGLVVKNLTWEVYRFQMLPDFNGVYVASVKSGGAADMAHVQEGDVIRKINGKVVSSLDQFSSLYQALSSDTSSEGVFLELIRDGHPYFTVLKPQSVGKKLEGAQSE